MDFIITFWNNNSKALIAFGYNIILLCAIIIASRIVASIARKAIDTANKKYERFDETLVPVLNATATYFIYGIGLVIILDIFGINTSSIIALLGAAGLAIGLALKDTLGNIAAGIMLLFIRPFKVKDYIESGSIEGNVKEINLFTTIFQTPDGIYIAAPNSVLWGNAIKNYTRNGIRRMDISVGISYGDSIDIGITVLKNIATKEERILKEPAFQVMVTELGDSSVNLQLRAWATVDDYWTAYWDITKSTKEAIEKAGLTIPFPQRELRVTHVTEANTTL